MPLVSTNLLLTMFLEGDIYSASADRRRFTTVDNQLHQISTFIGDGRIDGWEIQEQTFPNITVTLGSGLIDGYYVNTFDDQVIILDSNSTYYLFVQRRVGVIGTEGPKSNIVSIIYMDAGPPSSPTIITSSISTVSDNYTYNITLDWNDVTDVDLDYYEINRQVNSGGYEVVDTTITSLYVDTVDEDATYDYRIYSVDQSGNKSVNYISSTIIAPLANIIPPDPIEVKILASESAINILWKRPPMIKFSRIDHWLISYARLDTDDSVIEFSTVEFVSDRESYNERIDGLVNGQKYKVTIKSFDTKSRESSGVFALVSPQPSLAPHDPAAFIYSFTDGEFGVVMSLSWVDGSTEYELPSYKYKIYPQIGTQAEAFPITIPPNHTTADISLYTFDENNYLSIPENTLITLRITGVDRDGHESAGSYVRTMTPIATLTKEISDVLVEFNYNTRQIKITWSLQSDTYDINLKVVDDDLEGNYAYGSEVELINDRIGVRDIYVLENGDLGHKYTISLTPYNKEDTAGPVYTYVIISTVPGNVPYPEMPRFFDAKTGDKQILLTWQKSITDYTTSYRLYKKTGEISMTFADWVLLDTLPVSTTKFSDYGLINDQSYSYYITSVDIYDRESYHLNDGASNLNFVTATPSIAGLLTNPYGLEVTISGIDVSLSWDSISEEFDSFSVYRSKNNLHSWAVIATLNSSIFVYTDSLLSYVNGTIYYYMIGKAINDSDIIYQTTSTSPDRSICLGNVTLTDSTYAIDQSCARDIKDFVDPINEHTYRLLLLHKHQGRPSGVSTDELISDRVDLNNEIVVTDWITEDGRIWTTTDDILDGSYIVKVNGRLPTVYFNVNESGKIIFSEPIDVESSIEMKVLNTEEVDSVLEEFRFDHIHARQVAYGKLNKEQLPEINHDGRIKERLFPDRFLVERYNKHTFIIPQGETDTRKSFGEGTTFYAVIENDGNIENIIDFDDQRDHTVVGFQKPSHSSTTIFNLKQHPLQALITTTGNIASSELNDTWWSVDSSCVYAFKNSTYLYNIFLRFPVNIPKGSNSSDAYLHLKYDTCDSLVYSNTGGTMWWDANYGSIPTTFGDDILLDPLQPALRILKNYTVSMYKSSGSTYTLTTQLYTKNGFVPGVPIDGTRHTWNNVPTGLQVLTTPDFGGTIVLPDSIFIIYIIDTVVGSVGPIIGEHAEIPVSTPEGTENYFAKWDGAEWKLLVFKTIWSGFRININCSCCAVDDGDYNNINLSISTIKPSSYDDSVNLSTDISILPLVGSVEWNPTSFVSEQDISIDISSLINIFVSDSTYFEGKYIIVKVATLISSDNGSYRSFYGYDTNVSNRPYLDMHYVTSLAEVDSEISFQSEKSYHFQFEFEDDEPTRWIRLTTENTAILPNPIVDLSKRIVFWIKLSSGSVFINLGIIEIDSVNAKIGQNGGITGPIEWVGISEVLINNDEIRCPKGYFKINSGDWVHIDIDLQRVKTLNFEDGNGTLSKGLGVLEHIAVTVNPDDPPIGVIDLYIDKLQQIDDLIVAGTSQGIQTSDDFGISWTLRRLTSTPVHKFHRGINNTFLWAISADEVLMSVDPLYWFSIGGVAGIMYIRDIAEDHSENIYISTDKGVYFLDISLIYKFTNLRQTQNINAFTTDCYGLFDESIFGTTFENNTIFVSTEIGIFYTTDNGDTWNDSGMLTGGLAAYQFINISDYVDKPVIISITRKHVLRKKWNESNFYTIANLEEQHGIADIWKMEYFSDKLYVSTGNGVFCNIEDILSTRTGDIVSFERTLHGIDINDNIVVAFGLDKVKSNTESYQMFIGQENRLMVVQETGKLSVKKNYHKELPSFFVDNSEQNIGFIYNSFNNILCFREAPPVSSVVSAAYLPRRKFIAINGGWAQTNSEAEIFVYKNGMPTWLYFALDSTSVLAEIQLIKSKLESITNLDDYNSLYPNSETYRSSTISSINTMQISGENSSPVVNRTTVVDFLENYSRFLSLVNSSVISEYELTEPTISVSGIVPKTGTRAETLEGTLGILSANCLNIVIDSYDGSIDFATAYTESTDADSKALITFDKYDYLTITMFNSNISDIGYNSHRELEDYIEQFNTGTSSQLGRVFNTNLIKLGIFLESNNLNMFSNYRASNIQSKYYSAYSNSGNWYDRVNSTIDYTTVHAISNYEEPRYATKLIYWGDYDSYVANMVWIGTDNDIYQYEVSYDGITFDKVIRPGDNMSSVNITDITVINGTVYVVAIVKETGYSHIYYSSDYGTTWTEMGNINLPYYFEYFTIINNVKVVGAREGLFYCDNNFDTWYTCNIVLSPRITEDNTIFRSRISNFNNTTFIIAESDRYFSTSGSGIEFYCCGKSLANDMKTINAVLRFKNLTWIGTDKGLYNDGNSILSDTIQFGLQDIENDIQSSVLVSINCITFGGDAVYCCSSTGNLYRFLNNEWKKYSVSDLNHIDKILYYAYRDTEYILSTSYNKTKIYDVTDTVGIFG